MKKAVLFIANILFYSLLQAQGFTSWITGDSADFLTDAQLPGIVLAGGGGDNDQAMIWMLERAAGGDVVVIRASGADGYNDYFFSELGVPVNSVETIRFDGPEAANDPYVVQRIRDAEVLFMAGGDQYDYYQFWKDTPVEDAINFLINEKGVTVGGTSAGMAILGGAYYTPSAGSLQSSQALANPFHPNVEILGMGDFISAPFLENTVTDTHYDQRDRQGRHMTFLARLAHEYGERPFGIACNEYTAVCIDGQGLASVFGEYPGYDDFAYFLKSNCQEEFGPEVIQDGTPLTWNRQQSAVKVYKAPGVTDGSTTFDLSGWEGASGGTWESWYVEAGELLKVLDSNGDCAVATPARELSSGQALVKVYPNPFEGRLFIEMQGERTGGFEIRILNLLGRAVWEEKAGSGLKSLDLGFLPSGAYWLEWRSGEEKLNFRLIKN